MSWSWIWAAFMGIDCVMTGDQLVAGLPLTKKERLEVADDMAWALWQWRWGQLRDHWFLTMEVG